MRHHLKGDARFDLKRGGLMNDELKLYKDIVSLSGIIVFRYDSKNDIMKLYGGNTQLLKQGVTINNFVNSDNNISDNKLYSELARLFKEKIKEGFPELVEDKIRVEIKPGVFYLYKIIARKEFDDNWEEQGIIGKISLCSEEDREFESYLKAQESDEAASEEIVRDFLTHNTDRKNYMEADIVEKALDVLINAGNTGSGISQLLRNIANRYQLDCITVQEYDSDSDLSAPCFQWYDSENFEVASKIARLPFDNFIQCSWPDNDVVVDNIPAYNGDNPVINKMKNIGVKSVVLCKYMSAGKMVGWISFERHRRTEKWTESETTTFRVFTKFISAYLLNIKNYMELINKEEYAKTHDVVTGLPKYELFSEYALKRINNNKSGVLAIMYINLADFELVNDKYGHSKGDEILRKMADTYRNIEGRFVAGCRVNAGNYIGLINCFDKRGNKISAAMVDRMNENFEKICKDECPDINLTVYSGIVFLPDKVEQLENYISKAKIAMENARIEGINCVFSY